MRTYTCSSCMHQFFEGDREWNSAIEKGQCPACQMPLRNFHLHAKVSDHDLPNESWDEAVTTSQSSVASGNPLLSRNQANARLVGVKGWLYLLTVGLVFFGPLLGASRILGEISEAERLYPPLITSIKWATYKVLIWWTYLALTLLSIWSGWGLARGREWSVVTRAKLVLWIIGPIGTLIMGALVPSLVFGWPNKAFDTDMVANLISTGIAASVWTAYLAKSRRVRATYASQ